MPSKNELSIPEAAKNDPESLEVLRVWVANKGQHVSLRVGTWKDPFAWGILLADLARHLGNAYEQEQGLDSGETLKRIIAGMNAEMNSPTDIPTGSIS
jgi:Domain of unknown function (DUF5076)